MAVSTIKNPIMLVDGDYAESASVSVSNYGKTSTTINLHLDGHRLIGITRLQTSATNSVGVVGYNIDPETEILTIYVYGLVSGTATAKVATRGLYVKI